MTFLEFMETMEMIHYWKAGLWVFRKGGAEYKSKIHDEYAIFYRFGIDLCPSYY